ncbi:MAG: transglutaminase-like domain-containing protein [Chloroflexi bacterium]|nr:transglutaminase-like domain-containing protein [Chloroflexota bacterium]MCI0731837.1 transglutaminase-like domain-containing protein [Chloroflexota bacterium]
MSVRGRFYKTLAVVATLGLIISLIPQPVWAEVLNSPAASHYFSKRVSPTPLGETFEAMSSLADVLPPELGEQLAQATAQMGNPSFAYRGLMLPVPPEAPASPLSLSRVQSAYAASAAVNQTLVVTFTVTNNQAPATLPQVTENSSITDTLSALSAVDLSNDPNVVHNALLTDALLPPQAGFIDASPEPDNTGDFYTWNLGDIPPMGSVTMTLQLTVPASVLEFTELDSGAAVWGTWQGQAVSAGTSPITLAPDGFDGWLVCTIDANCNDAYIIEKAAQLGNDPVAIFEYVRSLGYESYSGSLRGARGTLWNRAGNSVDQASLLIALLRASGIPASYRHGTLDIPLAQELIYSMFFIPTTALGYVPPGTPVSDPANDPALVEEVRDHWWVQAYLPELSWTQLDPSFARAQINESFVPFPEPEQLAEVPDAIRHRVTIQLQVEQYHPLNIGSSGLIYNYPLSHTFRTVELVGNPITFGHLVNTTSQGGFIFSWVQHTYVPYLIQRETEAVIEGSAYQELISNFPFGTFLNTGGWLILEVSDPDGNTSTYRREVFDRIGFEGRQAGGQVALTLAGDYSAAVQDFDVHTMVFDPNIIAPEAITRLEVALIDEATRLEPTFAEIEALRDVDPADVDIARLRELSTEMRGLAIAQDRLVAMQYSFTADTATANSAITFNTRAYHDTARVIIASSTATEDAVVRTLDLRSDPIRTVVNPGQSLLQDFGFHSMRGVLNTVIENQVLNGNNMQAQSAAAILEQAEAGGIPFIFINDDRLDELAQLEISDEAKARIVQSINEGFVVVVPERMVDFGEATTIAWWRIDPRSGEIIGVGENGAHQGVITFTFRGLSVVITAEILYAFLLGLLAYLVLYILYLISVLEISISIPFPQAPGIPAPSPGIDWEEVWRRVKERMRRITETIRQSVPFGFSAP